MRDLHTNLQPVVGFRTKNYWYQNSRQPFRKVADPLSATPTPTHRVSTEAEAYWWQRVLDYNEAVKQLFKIK